MRYQNAKQINKGGQGRIYLMDDVVANKKVIFKVLNNDTRARRRRFEREVRILTEQRLNPYVVDIYDYDLRQSPPYMVLEYCAGGSLDNWIWNRPRIDHVAVFMQHIVLGLEGIHGKGGFHRDITPRNLGAADDGKGSLIAKLIDFGLSQSPNPLSGTMTRTFAGTPGYIAPEVEEGEDYSWQADIWSLGTTFREILTGCRQKLVFAPRSIPADLTNLLDEMTQPDPTKRPDTRYIYRRLDEYVTASESAKLPTPQAKWEILIAGLGILAAALSNRNKWDSNVGRYRNSRGEFVSGW
jgi:serine/threonine protein kinase